MKQNISMKKGVVFALIIIVTGNKIYAQTQPAGQTTPPNQVPAAPRMTPEMTEFYSPEVPLVTAGKPAANAFMTAPSDAIILFDGKDLSKWKGRDGGPAKWDVKDGAFIVKKRTGDISTIMDFNDFQLHIEWLIPANITGQGQARGNSGIFLQGIYEIQILDNYNNENKTYVNGQAGSIYKQTSPLKNVVNAPGQWNSYDIIYTAPRFKEDSTLFSPAYVTLIHNGVVIQNHTQLKGNTPYIGLPRYKAHGKGPIKLQDHGDPSEPINYRNIWIREL